MSDIKNDNSSNKVEEAKKIAKNKSNKAAFDGVEEGVVRVFRWLSSLIDRLFQGNYVAVFALLLAVILYFTANFSENGFATNLASSKTISEVSVVARYNSESFEVSGVPTTCDIVLTGDAAVVNNAATKSGYCLINLEGYTEGTHTVSLTASGYGDNVTSVVTPSETQIVLKHKTTSTFDIGYDFVNKNSLDSRYILSTPVFEDGNDKVNIRASQDTLNSISLVKALIDVSQLKEGANNGIEAPLIAYNEKGQQVNAEIVPSTIKMSVVITSPKKNVPITLKVTGETSVGLGLDEVSLDHETTDIYGPQDVLDGIDEVFVSLDLSTITSDADILQPITLPAGVSTSDVTMVNLKITLAETTTKVLENVPIVFRNNDNNLGASDVELTTVTVTVAGTENVLDKVTAQDCIVYIKLVDSEGNYLEPGTYDLPIYVDRISNTFASFTCEPNHLNITLVSQE